MKKILLILVITICLPSIMFAQKVEVTPFGGYVFGGSLQGDYGDVHINDNGQYGGMVSIAVSPVIDVDLIYNRSDTKADVSYYHLNNNIKYEVVPLSINYMHVGFTKNFRVNAMVSPFVGLNLGACLFAPKQEYNDVWFFSVGLNGGAKFYLNKRIGLRVQAQCYSPVQGTAFSIFIGTGGSGGGVSVYSTLIQFGFTGGLIFRI